MAGTKQYPGVLQITDTTFKLTITDGYAKSPDGTKKQKRYFKTVAAKSAKEASDLRSQWITEIKSGAILTNKKMSLKEFYSYFKKHSTKLAPKTIVYYDGLFTRIDSAIGHKQLNDITANNIRAFMKNISEPGIYKGSSKVKSHLSDNTIQKYYKMLNMLFNKAVKWGLMSFNPNMHVDSPKMEYHQKKIYDEESTGEFLLLLENEEVKHRALCLLALSTGMRRGELFGLQWKHLDIDAGTLKIEQASQYLPGKGIFLKPPKTEGSKRSVTISKNIASLLQKHKINQAAHRLQLGLEKDGGKWAGAIEPKEDFIFTKWNGLPAHPDSLNTWLKKFIAKNHLPHLTPQGFRHMAATFLITDGTDLRTVAGKLGHSNSTTTQIVYSHLLKTAEKETTDKMESFINRATEKAKENHKKQAK